MTLPASAWVVGFGSRLVPRAPFEIRRTATPPALIFAHHAEDAPRSIRVIADETALSEATAKPSQLQLGPGVEDANEVLEFIEHDDFRPGWSIVTRTMQTELPSGTTLWSTSPGTPWDFEITRTPIAGAEAPPADELAYVQGPFALDASPNLELLVGEGMKRVASGKLPGSAGAIEWIDIGYAHESVEWVQRRQLVPLGTELVALVTSQSRASDSATLDPIAQLLASTLRLRAG